MAIAQRRGAAVEPLGDFGDRFGVGLRLRPQLGDGREEIIARGRARAAEFTWCRTARAYLGLYRQVVEEAGR